MVRIHITCDFCPDEDLCHKNGCLDAVPKDQLTTAARESLEWSKKQEVE